MNAFPILFQIIVFSLALIGSIQAEPIITTLAGGGVPNKIPATEVSIGNAGTVTVDKAGNLFFSISQMHIVAKVDAKTGIFSIFAGNGSEGFSGDGGLATDAQLNPGDIAVDEMGNVFIADAGNKRVRRVDAVTKQITSVAGNGTKGFSGDGGPATAAQLASVHRIATDQDGNLFIADFSNNRVRRVDVMSGTITTVAGNGEFGFAGDDGLATEAQLTYPWDLVVDHQGNLFILHSRRIRKIDVTTGVITTIAGHGKVVPLNDGGPAISAGLGSQGGMALDHKGNIFHAAKNRIRRIDAVTGIITTVLGPHIKEPIDNRNLHQTRFLPARDVAIDGAGRLYIAGGTRIRRVDLSTGLITRIAGNGFASFYGENGPAAETQFRYPKDLAVDHEGNLFVADTGNHRIRKIDTNTGQISTVAGSESGGSTKDGVFATAARLFKPKSVVLDNDGNLFFVDNSCPRRVRRVDATTNRISTVAIKRFRRSSRNFIWRARTIPRCPFTQSIAINRQGILYFALLHSHQVQRFDHTTGDFITVAGTGTKGYSGDGQFGREAQLSHPHGLVVDKEGNLYIADAGNARVRRIDAVTGRISTVAGNGTRGFSGDGGLATEAQLTIPHALAVDQFGILFISDSPRIRRVDVQTGIITTVAGSGEHKLSGDGGPATSAGLGGISAIAVDQIGRIYVATGNRIRMISDPDANSISQHEGDGQDKRGTFIEYLQNFFRKIF